MTTPQRSVLIIGCLVAAMLRHFLYCSWSFGRRMDANTAVIADWSVETSFRGRLGEPLRAYYGIVAPPANTWRTAMAGGVLALWAFLVAAGYLLLGWKRASRRDCGACEKCGYQLHYEHDAGCPECGWGRGEQTAIENKVG